MVYIFFFLAGWCKNQIYDNTLIGVIHYKIKQKLDRVSIIDSSGDVEIRFFFFKKKRWRNVQKLTISFENPFKGAKDELL